MNSFRVNYQLVQRPIIVATMGRSGSSMVTQILSHMSDPHGRHPWLGACMRASKVNPHGFFENLRFKEQFEKYPMPRLAKVHPYDPHWKRTALEILRVEGYVGEPWIVKHSAVFWKFWNDFDPIFVLPRRDTDSILASIRKAGYFGIHDDEMSRCIIELHQVTLDYLRDVKGGIEVDTNAVVNGDLTTLERACNHCGLNWDHQRAREIVDPENWHFHEGRGT